MDTVKVTRVLRGSAILLTLVVSVLAAQLAAAEPNNGTNKVPNLHERVGSLRSFCNDLGGSFSVTYSPSKVFANSATTTCKESETTTTCTNTKTSTSCKTTTNSAQSTGPRSVASVQDVAAIDAVITPTEPQVAPAVDETIDTGAVLTVDEAADSGAEVTVDEAEGTGGSIPQVVEAEPAIAQPDDAEPIMIEATEDEDA